MKRPLTFGLLLYSVLMTGIALGSVARGQDDPSGAVLSAAVRLPDGSVYQFECPMLPENPTPTPEVYTPIPTNTPRPTMTPSVTPTPAPPCWGTVLTDYLNQRAGPGISSPVVGQLMSGARVSIYGTARNTATGDWYLVDNVRGLYVFSGYVGIGNTAVCGLELDPITYRAGGEDG